MVDRIMVDPAATPITERDLQTPRLMPGGLCFVCGTWVDHDTQAACRVIVEDPSGERQEFLAHVACLVEVAHPSSALKETAKAMDPPGDATKAVSPEGLARPEDAPPDYLAPKPFTADGR
jgi:hypothetical protein